jgi:hypothetical protein
LSLGLPHVMRLQLRKCSHKRAGSECHWIQPPGRARERPTSTRLTWNPAIQTSRRCNCCPWPCSIDTFLRSLGATCRRTARSVGVTSTIKVLRSRLSSDFKVRPPLWSPPLLDSDHPSVVVECEVYLLFPIFTRLGDLRRFHPYRHSPAACAARGIPSPLDPIEFSDEYGTRNILVEDILKMEHNDDDDGRRTILVVMCCKC